MHTVSPWLLPKQAFKYAAGRVVPHTHTTTIFRSSGPYNIVTTHTLKRKGKRILMINQLFSNGPIY
jgi:hypothetical protein